MKHVLIGVVLLWGMGTFSPAQHVRAQDGADRVRKAQEEHRRILDARREDAAAAERERSAELPDPVDQMGIIEFETRESRASIGEKIKALGFTLVPGVRPGWDIYHPGAFVYGEVKLAVIGFLYNRDRLARVSAVLEPRSEDSVVKDYLTLQEVLNRKYGTPLHDVKAFNYPYRWGDGNELNAIRTKRADVWTEWRSGGEHGDAFVRLVIVDDRNIRLDCQSTALMQELAAH